MVEKSLIFCFWGVGGHTVCGLRDFRVLLLSRKIFLCGFNHEGQSFFAVVVVDCSIGLGGIITQQ